jgi:hypothetical protein
VWLAEDDTRANLHYDRSHNYVVQLSGVKKWSARVSLCVFARSDAIVRSRHRFCLFR